MALWELHRTAATYGQRPSTLLRIDPDRDLAYFIDRESARFGTFIENKLNETDKRGKRKHNLQKLLGLEFAPPGGFASVKGLKRV